MRVCVCVHVCVCVRVCVCCGRLPVCTINNNYNHLTILRARPCAHWLSCSLIKWSATSGANFNYRRIATQLHCAWQPLTAAAFIHITTSLWLFFVSPVPEQPFPRTEDCTTKCYITELFARAICSTIFTWLNNPLFLQHFIPKTFACARKFCKITYQSVVKHGLKLQFTLHGKFFPNIV